MSRRPDPKRLHDARRAAVRNILIDEQRMSPARADIWIAAWEAEASKRGTEPGSEYWTIGLVWIFEQVQERHASDRETAVQGPSGGEDESA